MTGCLKVEKPFEQKKTFHRFIAIWKDVTVLFTLS